MIESSTLLSVNDVSKHFDIRRGLQKLYQPRESSLVKAVDGVSFRVSRGEAFGIIGESGCGKTTLGRTILRLQAPSSGSIVFDGKDISKLAGSDLLPLRRRMQIIFQDPYASLNPRSTVEEIVGMPLSVHRIGNAAERPARVASILEKVGLSSQSMRRYPHQFSGGQRQRIAIARALVTQPELVVCDEPVSALDVSVQAQVLHMLQELQGEFGLTYVFVSHNLAVVGYLCTQIAVMYLGHVVETGDARSILADPKHPYTEVLLSAVPRLKRSHRNQRIRLTGDLPSPTNPPSGCKFHPRCPRAMDHCKHVKPPLQQMSDGRKVACHLYNT